MRIGKFDTGGKILLIAEVGNNHEGSYARAEEMLGKAAECGAGAVKFQTFRTEHYVSRSDEARFKRLKAFELRHADFEKLAALARKAGMLFISTPFDLGSAEFLAGVVDAFKISSSDNTFFPLMEKVASTGKPVILSCGLADMVDVVHATTFIQRSWRQVGKTGMGESLAALHCVSAYPVPPEDANLGAITALKTQLRCSVGYSDHTLGIQAATLAAALGAEIVEKHFTLDKDLSDFRDHKISADPAELKQLAQALAQVPVLLGKGDKTVQGSEKAGLTVFRRSIAAERDLAEGETLTLDKLTWTRPAGGLPPGKEALVLGRRLRRSLKAGDAILPADCG